MLKTTTSVINASQIATPITLPGNVTLSTGNLVIGTAGKGIDFSATSGAGTSELLSDYEEGTFTATIRGGTTDPSTPQTGSGYYTKIGRQVTVVLSIDAFDTTGASGQIQISGMPFTAQAVLPRTVGQMYFSRATNLPIMPLIEPSGTLLKAVDALGNSVNYNSAGASTYTSVSITYIV
jgi:hypothetical protein